MRNEVLYIDGGVHRNRVAWFHETKDGNFVHVLEGKEKKTSNELEYLSLLKSLEYILQSNRSHKVPAFTIYSDSEILVKRINKDRKAGRGSTKHLRKLELMCRRRMDKISSHISIHWISRYKNKAGHVLESMYRIDRKTGKPTYWSVNGNSH